MTLCSSDFGLGFCYLTSTVYFFSQFWQNLIKDACFSFYILKQNKYCYIHIHAVGVHIHPNNKTAATRLSQSSFKKNIIPCSTVLKVLQYFLKDDGVTTLMLSLAWLSSPADSMLNWWPSPNIFTVLSCTRSTSTNRSWNIHLIYNTK